MTLTAPTETPVRTLGGADGRARNLADTHRVDHSDEELAAISASFERAPATKVIEWAVESFGHHLAMTASMTDAVLIDLAVKVDPAIEVIFIDTGYHFPETLATVEEVRRHYGLNLRMMTVARQEEELWEADPENCCSAVKVGQLDRALASKDAWMSGLRRGEAKSRAEAPIVSRDLRGLVKISPIATHFMPHSPPPKPKIPRIDCAKTNAMLAIDADRITAKHDQP